ncbi:response regulator [Aquabacter cavernae]|uniref:response regulator n=1 Tax=Aquabacter cavernae TaxID=2496029 RepID=UPI0013DF5B3A|nr:response regulator [Aquabacter cavernae]
MIREPSILICDDEADLAGELGEFFAACGWRAMVHTSAPDALEALHAGAAPTCLLTDLRVGHFSGAELVSATRRLPNQLQPLIYCIMTGHVLDTTAAKDFGVDLLYLKPIDPDLVLSDIQSFLEDTFKLPTGT